MKRIVFITGGSRGIGLAMVKKFKAAGDTVVTCARTEAAAQKSGADLGLACDVSQIDDVKNAIDRAVTRFGQIDILVNNAGLAGSNPLETDRTDELWHQIIDINLNGTYYFCKYALPYIPDNRGRIINIGSVLALKGVPDQTAYCAAKHAVLGFTRALSHAVAPRGITVNIICPGWTRTDMAAGRMQELEMSEKDLKTSVPLGRFIEPAEIAGLAFYLASEQAAGMTGQSLTMDGGVLA